MSPKPQAVLAALNVEHGSAGEGMTETEKKASLEVTTDNSQMGSWIQINSKLFLFPPFWGVSCFHLQAISRKSKRRVHYQKFVKVTQIFSILPKIFYCCVVAIRSYFSSQGKDSSNYSADDLGCILGTKSEKVTFWYLWCCSSLPIISLVCSRYYSLRQTPPGWSQGQGGGGGGEGGGGGGQWEVQAGFQQLCMNNVLGVIECIVYT